MAGAKEIRTKIGSVKNTQKITKAMEMVAASKMRRAQDRMSATRPYAERMLRTIGHLSAANPEYRHPFMVEREVKRAAVVVVSTDRGLCGGLNINLFRQVLVRLRDYEKRGVEAELVLIGNKSQAFFKRLGVKVAAALGNLGDTPHLDTLLGSIKVALDGYRDGQYDEVVLLGNRFVNTMTQQPTPLTLLPLQPAADQDELPKLWDYLYEPEPMELLDSVLVRYVESQVFQAVVENVACEMAARMIAMKAASDNAGDIIDALQLEYNKARQAAITQELAEIVGGAAAV
ncbi:MAG: F0F1 ATP synthase subunit gamma [Oceanococcaceae bacterium]